MAVNSAGFVVTNDAGKRPSSGARVLSLRPRHQFALLRRECPLYDLIFVEGSAVHHSHQSTPLVAETYLNRFSMSTLGMRSQLLEAQDPPVSPVVRDDDGVARLERQLVLLRRLEVVQGDGAHARATESDHDIAQTVI